MKIKKYLIPLIITLALVALPVQAQSFVSNLDQLLDQIVEKQLELKKLKIELEITKTQTEINTLLNDTPIYFGAPSVTYNRTTQPVTTTDDLGSYDKPWNDIFASGTAYLPYVSSTMLCLGIDCRTTFPSGEAFAWTPTNNFNENYNATSTAIWIRNNLAVSSTSYLSSATTTMINPWDNNTSPLGFFGNAWSDIFASGTAWLTTVEGVDASEVDIALGTGSPTVDQMQEYLDNTGSSGYFTGGILSDAGSGAVAMTAGEGFIRASADDNAPILSFLFAASTSIAIVSDTTRYIFVDDTGTISTSASEFDEAVDNIMIGVATDEGGSISHTFNLGVRLEESIGQMGRYTRRVDDVVRDKRKGGLLFGQSGDANRDVTVSEGSLWWGRTEYSIPAFDTSGADTFDTYTANGREHIATSSWDNINYDNGGTLTSMANNRWAVLWFYIEPDGHIVMIYGRNQYVTEGQAEDELAPASSIPNRISSASVIAAKFIFQKSSNTATKIESAFGIPFTSSGVTDHGNLAGLTDDDHTQYLLIDGTRSMTGSITPNGNNSLNMGAFGSAWQSLFVSSTTFLGSATTTMIEPWFNNTSNLGSFDNAWKDVYASGTARLTGELLIPMANNPTLDKDQELALDKTTTSLHANIGGTEFAFYTQDPSGSITIVSSTWNGDKGLTASSTIIIGFSSPEGETWDAITCIVDTGTAELEFGDGTNWMDYQLLTTTKSTDSSLSNNIFGMREERQLRVGQITSTVNYISCSVEKTRNVN